MYTYTNDNNDNSDNTIINTSISHKIIQTERTQGAGHWIPFGDRPLKLERYRED